MNSDTSDKYSLKNMATEKELFAFYGAPFNEKERAEKSKKNKTYYNDYKLRIKIRRLLK